MGRTSRYPRKNGSSPHKKDFGVSRAYRSRKVSMPVGEERSRSEMRRGASSNSSRTLPFKNRFKVDIEIAALRRAGLR